MSSTCTKSRRCSPSPKIVGASPPSSRVTKIVMTPTYGRIGLARTERVEEADRRERNPARARESAARRLRRRACRCRTATAAGRMASAIGAGASASAYTAIDEASANHLHGRRIHGLQQPRRAHHVGVEILVEAIEAAADGHLRCEMKHAVGPARAPRRRPASSRCRRVRSGRPPGRSRGGPPTDCR